MLHIGVTGHRFLEEGADQLVVWRMLLAKTGTHLIVSLALPGMDCLQDFGTSQSSVECEEL